MTMRDDVKRLGGLREAGKELEGQGEPEAIGAARGVAYFDGTGRVATRTAEQTQAGAATPAVPNDVVSAVSNEVQGESASSRANASGVQLSDFDKAVQASYDTLKAGEWPEYQSLSGITGLFDCTTGEYVRLAFGETAEAQQLPVYRSNCRQGLKPGWDSVSAYREESGCGPTEGYNQGKVWISSGITSNNDVEFAASVSAMDARIAARYASSPNIIRVLNNGGPNDGLKQYLVSYSSNSYYYDYEQVFESQVRWNGNAAFLWSAPAGARPRNGVGPTITQWDCAAALDPNYYGSRQACIDACNPDPASLVECDQDFEPCENGETDPNAEDCNPLNLITNPCDLDPALPYSCEVEDEWDSADCYREEKRGGLKAGWDSVSAYREEVGCAPSATYDPGYYWQYSLDDNPKIYGFGRTQKDAFMMAATEWVDKWAAAELSFIAVNNDGELFAMRGGVSIQTTSIDNIMGREGIASLVYVASDQLNVLGSVTGSSNQYLFGTKYYPFGGLASWDTFAVDSKLSCAETSWRFQDREYWPPTSYRPAVDEGCAMTDIPLECEQDFEACENGETDPEAEDCNPLELTQAQQCCPDPATVEPCAWQDDCLADYLVSDTHRISPNPNDPNANLPNDISAAQFCDNEGNDVRLIPAKDGGYIVSNQAQNVNFYRDPAGKVSYFDNTKILDFQA